MKNKNNELHVNHLTNTEVSELNKLFTKDDKKAIEQWIKKTSKDPTFIRRRRRNKG